MPELPEVETIVRGLRTQMKGAILDSAEVRRADLRVPVPKRLSSRLVGRRVTAVHRRGKYILINLDDDKVILVHLGMSGNIVCKELHEKPSRHDHVIFSLDNGIKIVFNDPRRFGMIGIATKRKYLSHDWIKKLGPEPLDREFNRELLESRLAGRQTSIKCALLDQHIVAGIGNIYACESLYRAGISPKRLACNIKGKKAIRLVGSIKSVLQEAIDAGGSSISNYVQASGEMGYFQKKFAVYGRVGEECPNCDCNSGVQRIVQAGRSTYYCALRQR